jgi:hypothetical protein
MHEGGTGHDENKEGRDRVDAKAPSERSRGGAGGEQHVSHEAVSERSRGPKGAVVTVGWLLTCLGICAMRSSGSSSKGTWQLRT